MTTGSKCLIGGVMLYAVFAWIGCTQATLVGNDLLDDQIRVVGFTDTFKLRTTVVPEDSIITHSGDNGPQIIAHKFGVLNDPYFGRTESVIITEMFLNGIGSAFLDYDVDSVVMTLRLDSIGRYGASDEPIGITVTRNVTPLDVTENYYSNSTFEKEMIEMGRADNVVPSYTDSVTLNGPEDTITLAPHLRIPMNQAFIDDLTSQPAATFEFTDSFSTWFQGVHIEMTEGMNTMTGVNLNNALSGLTIYYSDADSGFYNTYTFVFTGLFGSNVQVETYDHDYEGSVAEDFIGNSNSSDSLVFIQSLSGLNTEFEVVNLEQFENVLINQAILEFYVADLGDEDLELYPLVNRIQTRTLNDDGRLVNSIDVNLALSVNAINLFGGIAIRDDNGNLKYRMNITAGIQDIVQGRADNKIFLSSYIKQNNPRRLVLYGPGHSEYPAKLSLTFTRTQ